MKSPSPTSSASAFTLAAADVRLPAFSWRRAIAPLLVSAVVSAALTHSAVAHAAVTHAGSWPAQEKPVSVDIHAATRAVALDELADAAGWSLVVRDTAPPGAAIDLHIVKQAPGKVLDLILEDVPGGYTATRDGSIVSLSFSGGKSSGAAAGNVTAVPSPLSPPAPPAPPAPASPPAPPASVDAGELAKLSEGHGRGDDRTVTGGSLRIEKNETVHNVSIFGGNLEVFGTVTGNVSVLGGSAHLHDGAHVEGSSNIIGGAVKIDDGVVIDGDVGVLGGSVKRAPGAIIHGSVEGLGDDDGEDDDDEAADHADHHDGAHDAREEKAKHETEAEGVGFSVSAAALLFVFGALFLAFAPHRVERLRTELISRPVRSVVMGAVSSVALLVLVVMLVCTLLGIPVALLLAVGAPVVMLLGACVILTTVGGALLQHRSTNPNVHLAAGCALFFLVGLIPVVGSIMRLVLALAGLGIMVATRGAGLISKPSDTPPSTGMPYR